MIVGSCYLDHGPDFDDLTHQTFLFKTLGKLSNSHLLGGG